MFLFHQINYKGWPVSLTIMTLTPQYQGSTESSTEGGEQCLLVLGLSPCLARDLTSRQTSLGTSWHSSTASSRGRISLTVSHLSVSGTINVLSLVKSVLSLGSHWLRSWCSNLGLVLTVQVSTGVSAVMTTITSLHSASSLSSSLLTRTWSEPDPEYNNNMFKSE